MPYTLDELERQFRNTGRSRKGRKKYANDASYWDGGHCNWGGSHNLREDCQTLAGSFTKLESLREIKEDLKKCTSKSEYDAKKSNYIRKCDEALRGLQEKSASSSMFGVCIIWSQEGMDKHVVSKLDNLQQDVTNFRGELEREDYKWVEELNQLNLEISKLEAEIQKQRKEALNEKDPVRRAKILQLIEENGKVLEEKYRKKQEFGKKLNFNPKKKVDDLIESIKKAIERKNKKNPDGGGGGKPQRKNKNTNHSSSDDESFDSDDDFDSDDNTNNNNGGSKDNKNSFQSNQQLILVAGVVILIVFFLYSSQKETSGSPHYYYDF